MSEKDLEDLLIELAALAPEESDAPRALSDAALTAYREGGLPPAEGERLEALLASSPALRRRLAELAGHRAAAPRPEVREVVLRAFARARPAARTRRWRWVAAGALLAAVGLAGWLSTGQRAPLPAYELTARALALVRGEAELPEAHLRALPETELTLTVAARGAPVRDADFGLYRSEGGDLRRLGPGDGLELAVERGTATFRAPAGELLGGRFGVARLFVVVAHRGDLRDSVALAAEGDPAQLLAAGGARVLPFELELIASDGEEANP